MTRRPPRSTLSSSSAASDVYKRQIVGELLELAPPGEVKDVERDLRAIADPSAPPTEDAFAAGFQRYNNKEMVSLTHGDHQVLLSQHGMVESNQYMDPRHAEIVTVDPVAQEVVSASPMDESAFGAEPALRAALDDALQEYCREFFAEGAACAVYPDLTMCVSSRIYSPQKAWSGRWQSVYKYVDGVLSGSVDVSIHYYEFGNTVKNTHYDAPPVQVGADAETIVGLVSSTDLAYHKICTEDAADLKEQFKSLRRQLPITKSKIDWLKIQNEAKVKRELEGLQ
eukprot:TRINITY_DN10624_c0_g1_i2.p1 TRINITY_DN10624_c0_g1~~TRINITY_DN10624_c0_g1_i2.p1  ORF type:complete len:283 (-),score=64.44 TRINITY_DN10624_c0_g1_i2:293-1141(-)